MHSSTSQHEGTKVVEGIQIYQAVQREDVDTLQALLRNFECSRHVLALEQDPGGRFCADVLSWKDQEGVTPLILAARKKEKGCSMVQLLLEHGADANYNNLKSVVSAAKANGLQPTKNFGTALHEAAKQGCDTIVDMLIRSGAEPWILNRAGSTPFDFAQRSGSPSTVARFKALALHAADIKIMCGGVDPRYKACTAVVTPCSWTHLPGEQMMYKRVYLFVGSDQKAQLYLQYSDASVVVDGRHRARLDMSGPWRSVLHYGTKARTDAAFDVVCLVCAGSILVMGALFWFLYELRKARDPHKLRPVLYGNEENAWNPQGAGITGAPISDWPSLDHTQVFFTTAGADLTSFQAFTSFLFSLVDDRCQPEYHPTHMVLRHPGPGCNRPDKRSAHPQQGWPVRPSQEGSLPERWLPTTPSQMYLPQPGSAIYTSSGAYETGAGSSRPMASSASCPRRASCHAPQAEALADLPHQEPPSASAGHSRQHGPAEAAEEAALGSLQEDEGMCVICMAEPRQCGYLHGASLHVCVCHKCAWALPPGRPCPLCRQTIEAVLSVSC